MPDILDAIRRCALVLLPALALLSIVAFVRAVWKTDEISVVLLDDSRHGRCIELRSDHGLLEVVFSKFELKRGYTYIDPSKPPPKNRTLLHSSANRTADMVYVFQAPRLLEPPDRGETAAGVTLTYTWSVPALLVAIVCLPYPLRAFQLARRRQALARLGKCKRCGYDLRATPGFYPECGLGRAFSSPRTRGEAG